VRTILLADRVDTPHVRSALQFGVRAVVPKDSSPDMLFTTIRSVMQAEATTGPDHVRAAVESWQRLAASRRRSRSFGLTPREIEILRAVLAGRTNREIAEESRITENTVKTHLGHIFDKLGASNRLELALFAAHHRVLDGS
jgi:DNA-binding NarL/FixJ family response regulator